MTKNGRALAEVHDHLQKLSRENDAWVTPRYSPIERWALEDLYHQDEGRNYESDDR
jgi:hypothetical protein